MVAARNIFDIIPHYKTRICVMGSASGKLSTSKKNIKSSEKIGKKIAQSDTILVTSTSAGLNHKVAQGAKEAGGQVLGISPAVSEISHIKKYHDPVDSYDGFLFSGVGVMQNNLLTIRSSNGVIILPGGIGTLNGFTVAYDEGKVIGVLTRHGGVADHIKDILKFCHRKVTDRMVFSSDPEELVQKVIKLTKKIEVSKVLDDYLVGDGGVVAQIEAKHEKPAMV